MRAITAIITLNPLCKGFWGITLISTLTSQVRNPSFTKKLGLRKWHCVHDSLCPRSALVIHCVWLNILVNRASNTCVTQWSISPRLTGRWKPSEWDFGFRGHQSRHTLWPSQHRLVTEGPFLRTLQRAECWTKPSTLLLTRELRGRTQCPLSNWKTRAFVI